MADQHFTHLHLHTEFSLLDGAISIDKLIAKGKEFNFKALAISDHGNIFGAVKFFEKCKKAGIKPVLAMEAYFAQNAYIKTVEDKYYHLLLIVENEIGYKNLCKLISFSYQHGFYFKPRIDYEILQKHSDGLIATTACLGGHIPKLLMNKQEEQAYERIDWFLKIFGREKFFLEVHPEHQEEQKILNQKLFQISAEKNINLLAAGDSHYITLDDHEAHEVMLCINTHSKITDEDRYSFGESLNPIWSTEEMLDFFKDHPQAVWNSGLIADRCSFDFPSGKLFFPHFEIPSEHTQETFFTHLCNSGFQYLLNNGLIEIEKEKFYKERLDEEIDLIIKMGFVGYFLVVSDFIQWAKRNNIPVGPGRGSVAGSLVAWALKITNIDPIKYNLLFERFLNPERVSMPDIDIDFCIMGRDRVINYVREKYGQNKVCQIITFGTMMAKGVIKDVSRVLGLPFEDSNALTTLIGDQPKITLVQATQQEPRLKEMIENNPKISAIFDLAYRLEGLTRHASKHAAGIVISPEPIDEVLPVFIPSKSNELVTQYAMTELEKLGFLKIDFLGLANLTIIDQTIKLIKKNLSIDLDIDRIAIDDEATFKLIGEGKTSGVFQLESDGLKNVLCSLKPSKFEDIIAVNALYRPGPLGSGMVDDFIERRHGRAPITYIFPELEPILQETYGVIVYQEQVMKIASAIAGYSLGQADILRRAMGKKKAEVMVEQRQIFLQAAVKRGFDEKKSAELFDLMEYFAGYGFNKSHSAAYAMIAYQTAYLKAHYGAEFMSSLISLESSDVDKISFYLHEAKAMGLTIYPPDINSSEALFSVIDGSILFGLQGIKNVGSAALENIMLERAKRPFKDLLDFCTRVDLRTSNKRVIESLICAGAFDRFLGTRAQKFNELDQIMAKASEKKESLKTGQMDLFSAIFKQSDIKSSSYIFNSTAKWSDKEKLEKEKEVIGFYLSAHPLDGYKELNFIDAKSFDQILNEMKSCTSSAEPIVVGFGLLNKTRVITTKKGDKMAFVQLEDRKSTAEIVIFPKLFKRVEQWLSDYTIFVVKGNFDLMSTKMCKIKAQEFIPIDLLFTHFNIRETQLFLPSTISEQMVVNLKQNLKKGSTNCRIIFEENGKKLVLSNTLKINFNAKLVEFFEQEKISFHITL